MFCKHRWVNVKKWVENKTLEVIQKCRWCNRWQRVELPFSTLVAKRERYGFRPVKPPQPGENPGGNDDQAA